MKRPIVLLDAIDIRRLAPGRYITRSDAPAYAQLRAAALRGHAREGVSRAIPDVPGGQKAVVFDFGPKANDEQRRAIKVGARFFQAALKDYENWPVKWWREAIQNAVDAKAKTIECGVVQLPDNTFRVWCQDDGRGMSRETLLNKFLVLGESGKDDDHDAKGGFGKAKEMLILPWLQWKIHTRDALAVGAGIDYEVSEAPNLAGTRVEVVMPQDNATSILQANEFVARCYLKGITFRFVEQTRRTDHLAVVTEVHAELKPGKLFREIGEGGGKAKLYFEKPPKDAVPFREFYVRTGGLFMFDKWLPAGVEGRIIVELVGKSTDLLTANRDGIRDPELRRAIDDFASELARDVRSATKAKSKAFHRAYRGAGKFRMPRREQEARVTEAAATAIQTAAPVFSGTSRARPSEGGESPRREQEARPSEGGVGASPRREQGAPVGFQVAPTVIRQMVEALGDEGAEPKAEGGEVAVGPMPEALAAVMLAATPVGGQTALEKAIKQMVWRPDFYVANDEEDWRPPASLLPEKMSKAALALAKVWTELVRFALIRLESGEEFGVGWVFSEGTRARYLFEEGEHWILLCPYADTEKRDKLLDPKHPDHIRRMWASALHEATHMADGLDYHDERFASALTDNIAKTADAWPVIEALVKAMTRGTPLSLDAALAAGEAAAVRSRGRGRGRVVERVVERVVDRPVEVLVDRPVEVLVDRPVPVPTHPSLLLPRPAQRQLELRAPVRRPYQPSLGLGFKPNDRAMGAGWGQGTASHTSRPPAHTWGDPTPSPYAPYWRWLQGQPVLYFAHAHDAETSAARALYDARDQGRVPRALVGTIEWTPEGRTSRTNVVLELDEYGRVTRDDVSEFKRNGRDVPTVTLDALRSGAVRLTDAEVNEGIEATRDPAIRRWLREERARRFEEARKRVARFEAELVEPLLHSSAGRYRRGLSDERFLVDALEERARTMGLQVPTDYGTEVEFIPQEEIARDNVIFAFRRGHVIFAGVGNDDYVKSTATRPGQGTFTLTLFDPAYTLPLGTFPAGDKELVYRELKEHTSDESYTAVTEALNGLHVLANLTGRPEYRPTSSPWPRGATLPPSQAFVGNSPVLARLPAWLLGHPYRALLFASKKDARAAGHSASLLALLETGMGFYGVGVVQNGYVLTRDGAWVSLAHDPRVYPEAILPAKTNPYPAERLEHVR